MAVFLLLCREVDSPILDQPAQLLCELDNAALRVEEEQGFGVGDGNRRVRLFTT